MDGNEAGPGDWERAPAPEDWQAVVDAAFQGIWTLDDRAVTTWVNRRMAGLLGSEPQEIVGLPLEAFLFPEDLEDHRLQLEELRRGGSVRYRRRLRQKDGGPLWTLIAATPQRDAGGRHAGSFALVTDLTPQVESEAARARFLQTLIDAMPHPVYYKDREGRYLGCNRAFGSVMGTTKEELVGRTVLEVFPGANSVRAHGLDEELLAHSGVQFYESLVVDPEGEERPVFFQKATFDGADGEVGGLIGSIVDLTDLKRAEASVRRLNDELENRVRDRTYELLAANTELESFAYSVSHDLRAPLRAITSFSQLVRAEGGTLLPDSSQAYLDRVIRAAAKMSRLIDALLGLYRIARREIHPQRVDLTATAREIVAELLATQPGRCVDFRVESGLEAEGDLELLRVVLRNLLENALKFTGERDESRIEVGATAGNPPGSQGPRRQVFFVRDNGVGFDMAYSEKLFGPFQRLHAEAEFPGSGIGLATAQRIVHRHGGTIWADAALDRGATFSFTLAEGAA